jgi:hypothetical protein
MSYTRTSRSAGWPDASANPKFARYAADCATCCSDRIFGSSPSAALPMKASYRTAGMNCPNVPFGVKL